MLNYLDGAGISYFFTAVFSGVTGLLLLIGSVKSRIRRRFRSRSDRNPEDA